jgi:predicted Zn-ribbon and HTH transcriptional regulator
METKLIINTCKQCGWQWAQHRTMKVSKVSPVCPKCDSKYWNGDIRIEHKCQKCGYEWGGRVDAPNPKRCPQCNSSLWRRNRKEIPHGENFGKVIELRKSTPCLTLKEVGDKLGVTGERVRQILKKAEMPTYHYFIKRYCSKCGARIDKNNQSNLCRKCKIGQNKVPLVCDQCGNLFYREPRDVLRRSQPHTGYYCSRQCYGKHFGTHYGRGRQKELAVK